MNDIFGTVSDMDVVVFVVDGVADFGYAALLETFNTANAVRAELPGSPEPWRVRSASFGATVRSGHGNTVPTIPLDELGDDFELMIVPAVNVLEAAALVDLVSAPASRPVLDRLIAARDRGAHLAGACTGTFFLAEAGVLDGSPATTSWWLGPSFRRRYPRVDLDEGRTLCRGRGVSTAGAALSHMDLALSLIAAKSPALAERAMRYLAVGAGRPQREFIVPEIIARGDSVTAAFERWVRAHLGENFRIAHAARAIGVTERSLQRATHAELGMSPTEFVHDIRLERAVHLLRTTSLTVDAVAAKVGYLNAGTLRGLFRRRRGMSISEIRMTRLSY
ncbi:AraC family transcriptional regulator [Nocardia sputorum]|uniref:AraC family transcriptional regulator n=2 Tax=Nocardiaceae TaxID=85025 RepID=A0ABN6U915_9NOCA|nr:AraC family transcriptional regulator [Nocardia sputorum]BDU01649.1 AraC family transcriptional regulator [Nocardia sputorum]